MVQKQTKKVPKEIADLPPIPEIFKHLWRYFQEIRPAETLTYSEIEAWSRVTCQPVSGEETLILKQLDNIWRNVIHGHSKASSSG